jgi:hypothetical protein
MLNYELSFDSNQQQLSRRPMLVLLQATGPATLPSVPHNIHKHNELLAPQITHSLDSQFHTRIENNRLRKRQGKGMYLITSTSKETHMCYARAQRITPA